MAIIAKSCRSLQHLGLRQCAASRLTLKTLADNCHLVSSLNIAGIDNLTDAALGSLAENMPLLREVDASWNSILSDTGISTLLRCCNKLKKVVLCGLKLITSQPFLGIIGDLKRWQLLEELWLYGKRRQTSSSQGKVALKTCDSVSSELQEWQFSRQLPKISYLDANFGIVSKSKIPSNLRVRPSATSFPKYQRFQSQIITFGTSCKQPPFESDRHHF